MDEIWVALDEFPSYAVTNYGTITNIATRRDVRQSQTKQGAVKVGLMRGGVQYTRSVKVLVAETFVDGRSDIFDTPINLDGDPRNNNADNLAWRPRWFAWKYSRQFSHISKADRQGPVRDLRTREVYDSVYDASITNGLLMTDVWRSIHHEEATFPTKQQFGLIKQV